MSSNQLDQAVAQCNTLVAQCVLAANECAAALAAIGTPAPLNSPHFTGIPTAPTAAPGTNTDQLATTNYLDRLLGTANGVATLNSMGQVPASQLASSTLNYKGTWNATTNTPTITSGVGTDGDFYIVAVAGTTTIDGISSWAVGDQIIFDGTVWQKVPLQAFVSTNFPLSGLATQAAHTVVMNNTAGVASPTAVAVTDLVTAMNLGATYATLASPALTGAPTAPTPSPGDNTTKIATTAFVAAMFAGYALLASPAFSGTPTAPTQAQDTNSTAIATCGFVIGQASDANPLANGLASPGTSIRWSRSDHTHPSDPTRAPLASPVFTGTPQAPTPVTNVNTTQIPTTAWVNTFFATIASLSSYAPLASPTFTGTPAAPTATGGTNTTQIATCAFVQSAVAGAGPAAGAGISVSGSTVSVDTNNTIGVGSYAIIFIITGVPNVNSGSTFTSDGVHYSFSATDGSITVVVPNGQVWRNISGVPLGPTAAGGSSAGPGLYIRVS